MLHLLRVSKSFLMLLSILLILSSFGFSSSAQSMDRDVLPQYERENLDIELFQKSLSFREEFGLSLEKQHVLNVINSQTEQEYYEYGVPLTPDEEKEIGRRIELQETIVPQIIQVLEQKGQLQDSDYTLYIDQKNGGKIVLKLKQDLLSKAKLGLLQSTLSAVNLDQEVIFQEAIYTEQDLDNISEKILEIGKSQEMTIDSISVDVIEENIIIGLVDYSVDREKELTTYLSGVPIKVIQVEPPSDNRAPYGGEIISNSRGSHCSTGYYATKGSAYYLVTAGHCSRTWNNSTKKATFHYSDVYSKNGERLGQVSQIEYGGSVDALTVTVNSSTANSYININGASRKMTSFEARNTDVVGQVVCKTGYKTGSTCSTLQSKNVSLSMSGAWFTKLRGSSYTSDSGDSGGTVYANAKYLGVHKGTGGGYKLYSQIGEVNHVLGLTPYLK